jgi:DNA-binding response OmpR family regulator
MAETSSQKILIVDDNPRVLKLLELRFSQLGYQVTTAERVKDAVVTAIIVNPDLVVSELQLPDLNGIEFKRIFSSIPALVDVPIIFITSDKDLPVDFLAEPGAPIDQLQKPYAFDELLDKVKTGLRRALLRKSALNESDQQTGVLEEMTLTDILQVVTMNKRTCTISLKREGQTGRIYFQGGRIVDAKAPGLRAEEAFYQLITWRGADYSIGDEPQDSLEETVTQDTRFLLAEGMRRLMGLEEKAKEKTQESDLEEEKTIVLETEPSAALAASEELFSGGQTAPDPYHEEKTFLKGLAARGLLKQKGD